MILFHRLTGGGPSIIFATASPAKFPEAIRASGVPEPTSEVIQKVLSAPARYTDLELNQNWTAVLKVKVEDITNSLKSRT